TPDEAVDRLRPAMRTWLASALEEGREIPAPARQAVKQRPPSGHSGRFLVRMPGSLHEQLANAAKREQLSLNRFVTNVLAAAVSPALSQAPSPTVVSAASPATVSAVSPAPSPAVVSAVSPTRADATVRPSEHTVEPSPRSRRETSRALRVALATNMIVVV